MKKTGTPNEYRRELKVRILTVAMREFVTKGLRAVKMDDIAHLLGISKRTLYEIYNNKEDLVLDGLQDQRQQMDAVMSEYASREGVTVIDILSNLMTVQMKQTSLISPVFVEDIERYDKIVAFIKDRQDEQNKKAAGFFRRGVEEGYFRRDVDFELVTTLGNIVLNESHRQHLYLQYPFDHFFRNSVLMFIRGISTTKGAEALDRL